MVNTGSSQSGQRILTKVAGFTGMPTIDSKWNSNEAQKITLSTFSSFSDPLDRNYCNF